MFAHEAIAELNLKAGRAFVQTKTGACESMISTFESDIAKIKSEIKDLPEILGNNEIENQIRKMAMDKRE